MSEAELHILRARLDGGIRNKAARGELYRGQPIGYVRGSEGDAEILLDPDEAVHGAIRAVFERFAEFGSARRVWRWFVMEKRHMRSVSVLLIAVLALTAAGCADRTDEPTDDRTISLERNSEFDGATLRFFLTLEDGTEASVNSDDDVIGLTEETTPLPHHRARAFAFLRDREAGTSLAYGLLSWDPANPEDYLVFGWWAEFPGQHPPVLSLADSLQYAIVDGPELDHGLQPELPVDGTASYVGQAGGLYSYVPGGDPGENGENLVIEEYEGMLTLTADFRDRTVRGCIGCEGDLVTRRAHFGVILGPGLGTRRTPPGITSSTLPLRLSGTTARSSATG